MNILTNFFPKVRGVRHYFLKNWVRLLIAVVVLGAAFFVYRTLTAEPKGIITQRVYRLDLVSDFTANGKIKAKNMADLKFYSPGKVSWIGVKKGDKIQSGQSVASLDRVALSAAHKQALNNLRNFQASAEKVLDDVQGHETDESFAQRAVRTTAEVDRDNAYEAILAASANLRNATIVSPISGTVVDTHNLLAGLNLTGADVETKFIRIVDLASLYFEAQIDEVDFSNIKEGQEVIVEIDAYPEETCNGKVSYFGKDGQETTGGVITIPAEVTFTDCNLEYAVGLNGRARFVLSKREGVLVIQKKFIVTKDGQDYVWKQTGKSTKERKLVPVKLGGTSSTELEIVDGVSEGDIVVFIP